MKRLLLFLPLFFSLLFAQVQILPDLEVSGESQVRMYLYKKALPYNLDSIVQDSLQSFVPSSILDYKPEKPGLKPKLNHFLHIQLSSKMGADLNYRFIPNEEYIRRVEAGGSFFTPKSDSFYRDVHFNIDGKVKGIDNINLAYEFQSADGLGLKSSLNSLSLSFLNQDIELKPIRIKRLVNELNFNYLIERGMGDDKGLGLTHRSELDFKALNWGNSIYIGPFKPVWQSYLEIDNDYLQKAGIHILYANGHFVPSLGFNWLFTLDYDKQLSLSNEPAVLAQNYLDELKRYQFISFADGQKNSIKPLNFQLSYQSSHPASPEFSDMRLSITNTTVYQYDKAMPRKGMDKAPILSYQDSFSNLSELRAKFGKNAFVFEQGLVLDLSYLPKENWIRSPYQPLFQSQTSAGYDKDKFKGSIYLSQEFGIRNHKNRHHPEIIDLGLRLDYAIKKHSNIYFGIDNLFDSDRSLFDGLPKNGICLYSGLHHRF